MKTIKSLYFLLFPVFLSGCAPLDDIYSHEFGNGYYKLKRKSNAPENIYVNMADDSLTIFPLLNGEKRSGPDLSAGTVLSISKVEPGSQFYNSTLIRTSGDLDLSTILLKYRPAAADVPPQLSANVNGVLYTGFRKDFFKIKTNKLKVAVPETFIRHTGLDFGPFAGIGITPVNPTVTEGHTIQEYDGIVFQKGFSFFLTFESMSVGFAIGFDTLLDHNKSIWIYNNKPWIGLVLGIANF